MFRYLLPPVPTLTCPIAEALAQESFNYGQNLFPPKIHQLDHYVIHDKNRDDYLDPEDSVFFNLWGGGQEFTPVDPAEFKKYLGERFDHRGQGRFWLEGARQYLKIQEWWYDGPGFPIPVSKEIVDRNMESFTVAQEFATLNGLEFSGKNFLAKVHADLEHDYQACPDRLDHSLNLFIKTGDPTFYYGKRQSCHWLADSIDRYLGEYRRHELWPAETRAAALGIK